MTKFVKLCATEEGFWKSGSVPMRNHNPMDLRHSPHSRHDEDPNGIGVIDSDVHGFEDAERQAQLWATRGFTLKQAIYTLAPPNENNTEQYLDFVISGFGGLVDENTSMRQVLEIQA
jgi:hypothetical protein